MSINSTGTSFIDPDWVELGSYINNGTGSHFERASLSANDRVHLSDTLIRCNHNHRILIQTRFFEFTKDPADLLIYKRHRCEISCLDFLRSSASRTAGFVCDESTSARVLEGSQGNLPRFQEFQCAPGCIEQKPLWCHEWSVRAVKPQSQKEWFPGGCEFIKFSNSLRRTDPSVCSSLVPSIASQLKVPPYFRGVSVLILYSSVYPVHRDGWSGPTNKYHQCQLCRWRWDCRSEIFSHSDGAITALPESLSQCNHIRNGITDVGVVSKILV